MIWGSYFWLHFHFFIITVENYEKFTLYGKVTFLVPNFFRGTFW